MVQRMLGLYWPGGVLDREISVGVMLIGGCRWKRMCDRVRNEEGKHLRHFSAF